MKGIEIDYKLDAIQDAAKTFLEMVNDSHVLAFSGELGAGKTTFISNACKLLGVEDIVSSPTFSIVQQYHYPGGNIYHMDLYRIKDEEEAANAGLTDCIGSGDLCFIEWPEDAPGILPENAVLTRIIITGTNTRRLQIQFPRPSI